MHFCLVTPHLPPDRCGVGDYSARLAEALVAAGHRVTILTERRHATGPGVPGAEVRATVGSWGFRGKEAFKREARAIGADRLVLEWEPHLYHPRGMSLAVPFAVAELARGGQRVQAFFHEMWVELTAGRSSLVAHPVQRAAARLIVAASSHTGVSIEAWAETLARKYPAHAHLIEWIPVGATILPDGTSRADHRSALKIEPDEIVVIHFSPRGSGKATSLVDGVWSRLKDLRRVRWVVIGSERKDAGRLLPGMSAAEEVLFTGYSPPKDVSRWLAAADLCLVPFVDGISSRRTSAVAAMAHGLPVASTAGKLTDSIFRSGPVLLWPADTAGMAEAARKLLADPKALDALRKPTSRFHDTHFAWRRIVDKIAHPPSRVLHVAAGKLFGGVETLLATMAAHRGSCPSVELEFAVAFEGELAERLRRTGAAVHPLGAVRLRAPWGVLRARRRLGRLIRERRFDAVVCHGTWPLVVFGPAARRRHVPLVLWAHDVVTDRHWLDRRARHARPDLIVANSKFTLSHAERLFHTESARVIYPPVAEPSLADTAGARVRVRKAVGAAGDAVVILQASRLESWKGHETLLEALALMKDLPRWSCWIAGGPQRPGEAEYLHRLERRAGVLGIQDRIRFLGARRDLPEVLAASDIFCQPNSGPEPFGVSLVEAMYARLPVVTSAFGGALESVTDECGVTVPPGDTAALARALRRLVEDSALRSRLGAHGPARAHDLCEPAQQLGKLKEVLSVL
jgi:glycosyltransferase involved in cell wall biosynthesis